jgi:hypothetical protein
VKEKTKKMLKIMVARAKNGVAYVPEEVVKNKMKGSSKRLKRKVAKAMRTTLGMKERRIITKRERKNRKNKKKKKKEQSDHGKQKFSFN